MGGTQDAIMDGGQAAILYGLALAIGGSHDTERVLRRALGAFVRLLGCTAGAIYLASPDILADEPALAIPAVQQGNGAAQLAAALLPGPLTRGQWLSFCEHLPQAGDDAELGRYCLLPIGRQGLLVLAGPDARLDGATVTALLPLAARLDEALQLCLEYEVLASAHHTAVLEGNILRTVLEATPTVLLAVDNEGRYIFSEGHALEALGARPGGIVGQSVFEVFIDAPDILQGVQAALAGEPSRHTVQLNNRNWDVTYEPLIEETGLVTCVVGVAHDVTERTTALESLSAVLQTVGEGILSLDTAGHIVLVNPELERTFGYQSQELLGQPISLLLPAFGPTPGPQTSSSASLGPQTSSSAPSFGAQTSSSAPSFGPQTSSSAPSFGAQTSSSAPPAPWRTDLGQRCELEGRRKDGSPFPVEVCINEIISGDQVRYTGSLRDIAERKEYERLRDEFVSTVSHELRTPLASIMGWTETLLTEHPGPINDSQRRFLNIVYASSQRLNRLIEEILTVSRIQRGTLRIQREEFDPAHLLANVQEGMQAAAERQGIRLDFADGWPVGKTVSGDQQLLEQVLNNLIGNALKFSRKGAEVSVRSLAVNGEWRVEVQDHGMGVRAADLPKLFQRFVRGSNAKEVHTQGAGLGLFVSKAIVEAHGGEIYLTSREGEGTTVWFDLPLRRPNGASDLEYGE